MSSGLLMRTADAGDLPQVLALYGPQGLGDAQVLSPEAAADILAQFARYPNYRLWVAVDAIDTRRVRGSYALLVMHNLAHMGTPSAIVEDVVVDPVLRGRGIGRLMMDHAREQARQAGCYKLALSSNRRREAAHAFYDSLGFERHGYSFVIDTPTP